MEERNDVVDNLPKELGFVPIGHPDSMMSVESVRRAVEEFRVRPTDVVVSTFPKTGTTVLLWLCHLIRTNGVPEHERLSFDYLYDVCPWPLPSWDMGYDPNETRNNDFFPRVFKSHLRMASVYRGCRYVVAIRDPARVALSFYNYMRSKGVPLATNSDASTFLTETPFVKGVEGGVRPSLWEFYEEYHVLRNCDSMLVVVYEDLVSGDDDDDASSCVRTLSRFLLDDVDADDAADHVDVDEILRMSSKEYMSKFTHKFDEPYERVKELGRAADMSQFSPGAKVVTKAHEDVLNNDAKEFLRRRWEETMAPLGYANYEEFADHFRRRNKERFSARG